MSQYKYYAVILSAFCILFSEAASSLRESAQSFVSRSQRLAFVRPSERTWVDSQYTPKNRIALNYRSLDEGMTHDVYTDRLWQTALVADSIRVELQPDHEFDRNSEDSNNNEELIETAKAFIPVAIEIGAVAALAAHQLT
eukprot:scaffold32603_cov68-Cyclotella_meneghiniana.AAC.10